MTGQSPKFLTFHSVYIHPGPFISPFHFSGGTEHRYMRCIIVVALQEIKKSVRKCKLAPQKTELVFVHLLCSHK